MKIKQSLTSKIRGWFPQDPQILRQASPTPKPAKTTHAAILNKIASIIMILGAVSSFVFLSTSWIKLLLVTVTAVFGLTYLIIRRHKSSGKRILKKALFSIMLFALCFTAVEFSLFYNAGYPATYSATTPGDTLTKESLLNLSTTEILEEIQQSPAFSLLKLEHPGQIRFESLTLSTWQNEVRATFCLDDGKQSFQFSSQDGSQYHLSVSGNSGYNINQCTSVEEAKQTLEQIDTVGLEGFYNKTLDNSTVPTLETLSVYLSVRSSSTYDGLTLQIAGYHQQSESERGIASVISNFQPNGELISKWAN